MRYHISYTHPQPEGGMLCVDADSDSEARKMARARIGMKAYLEVRARPDLAAGKQERRAER